MKAVVIPPDRPAYAADLVGYDQTRAAVGGDLEAIPWGDRASAYLDEDGKARDLPINHGAMLLGRRHGLRLWPGDVLVGPVVLLGGVDADGNDTDLPADLADDALTLLGETR
jgi:hypothetical protein